MNRTALIIGLSAIGVMVSAQIPEHPKWEIAFSQVETAAGLSNLRGALPDSFEARLMERPWSAIAPVSFLRLRRADGLVRAELFVFWATRNYPPGRQPSGSGVECRDGVCVKGIALKEQRDWGQIVAILASQDACPKDKAAPVVVCGDCDQIWIKTVVDGKYREQSCQLPGPETVAGQLLELMKTSAGAAR